MTATNFDGLLAPEHFVLRYYDGVTHVTKMSNPEVVLTSGSISATISGRTITFNDPLTGVVAALSADYTYPINDQENIFVSVFGRK